MAAKQTPEEIYAQAVKIRTLMKMVYLTPQASSNGTDYMLVSSFDHSRISIDEAVKRGLIDKNALNYPYLMQQVKGGAVLSPEVKRKIETSVEKEVTDTFNKQYADYKKCVDYTAQVIGFSKHYNLEYTTKGWQIVHDQTQESMSLQSAYEKGIIAKEILGIQGYVPPMEQKNGTNYLAPGVMLMAEKAQCAQTSKNIYDAMKRAGSISFDRQVVEKACNATVTLQPNGQLSAVSKTGKPIDFPPEWNRLKEMHSVEPKAYIPKSILEKIDIIIKPKAEERALEIQQARSQGNVLTALNNCASLVNTDPLIALNTGRTLG